MAEFITADDFKKLKQSLPIVFHPAFENEQQVLTKAFPLLNRLCDDRDLIARLKATLELPAALSGAALEGELTEICTELESQFTDEPMFIYRLPIIISEFPVHSRPINKYIEEFNALVEAFYSSDSSDEYDFKGCYQKIIQAIMSHGAYCNADSLWQLLEMMSGWSVSLHEIGKEGEKLDELDSPTEIEEEEEKSLNEENSTLSVPVKITELKQATTNNWQDPFVLDYSFNYNGAGLIARETHYLLLNAFGMKIGGHFDAQVKYPPRFIPLAELHALIQRQLSHRMQANDSEEFKLWIEATLRRLGVQFIQKNDGHQTKDILVNPFLSEPMSFINPEKIQTLLIDTLGDISSSELSPSQLDINVLALYLYELLQGFQINPGQALGIGANWDGTVNLSNEAGAYAFKFTEQEAPWGRRFRELSLHRQGPSEAKMNAAIGIKYELESLLSSQQYMSQLQASEQEELLYNALVDNLVCELFPEPAYFENAKYPKYLKQYLVKKGADDSTNISSFYVPSPQGTYFKHNSGEPKQTPMYRRPGTLDVVPFPKDSTCCEHSKAWYEGNPLGPLQLQHAQAMHRSTRGHWVYNPIGPDQFLEDAFYGQVIRTDNGDFLPFIGVVPKNFDKHFKQKPELCASFVLRMLQSARIMEYCPTFVHAYEQIKARFLPTKDTSVPDLPNFCSAHVVNKGIKLKEELAKDKRSFKECEHQFYGLFKNLIYSLYQYGLEDEHFKHNFLAYVSSRETFYPMSKAKCEKLIRDLSVNRPAHASNAGLTRYDDTLSYLRQLCAYFYPTPSDELAKEVAHQARLHVMPLAQSKGVKDYFKQQTNNSLNCLSRRQSPGMIFSTLKKNGPLNGIHDTYRNMHKTNLSSYYRDSDGTSQGAPQKQDKLMDWGAKTLGETLRFLNRYNLFAILHYPFSETYLRARQRRANHKYDKNKALWTIEGGLEGFLVHGLAKGAIHSVATPFQVLGDCVQWTYQQFVKKTECYNETPLSLPSAPANDPGIKALAAGKSRDLLLKLLGSTESIDNKKDAIIDFILEQAANLYPYLSKEEIGLYRNNLITLFPLALDEWQALFKPLLIPEDSALSKLLHRFNPYVNKSLLQAVFRCITNAKFLTQAKLVVKDTDSFFALSTKQKELLEKILALYTQASLKERQQFSQVFRFDGDIHNALKIRDKSIQETQAFMLSVFDEQSVLEFLLSEQIDDMMASLNENNLQDTLKKLPVYLREPLEELISSNDEDMLNEYVLTEKQRALLIKINTISQQLSEEARQEIVRFCQLEFKIDDKLLSVKDKAHDKWARFAERELKHQRFSNEEADELFKMVRDKLSKHKALKSIIPLVDEVITAYTTLEEKTSLTRFFENIIKIDLHLTQCLSADKKSRPELAKTQSLLNNFLNITMNAVVNARLDNVDVFSPTPENPLLQTVVIEQWLVKLQENNQDLRAFLAQQVRQAPSLDHALWRCQCILQILELNKPDEKISHTGMQSLVRFWIQHRDNVLMTGEQYFDPTGEPKKCSPDILSAGSVTMQHAINRVKDKMPLSIFRQMPSAEKSQLDSPKVQRIV